MSRRWLFVAALLVVALVLIGAHGHNEYLYKQCVAIQHGTPPSQPLTGFALSHGLSPARYLVLGRNISGYVAVGTGGPQGAELHELVHCERGWP